MAFVHQNKRRIGTHGAYRCMAAPDMPRFFLAFSRILCYSVAGATSTPVGGSPRSFSGVIYSLLPPYRKGGRFMDVTWEGIFQFCLVIIAVIGLVLQVNNKEK